MSIDIGLSGANSIGSVKTPRGCRVPEGSAGSRTILEPILTRVEETPRRARRPSAHTSRRSSGQPGTPVNSNGSSNSSFPASRGSKFNESASSE
eukprot:scaffold69933_cov25-Tisochrysis_lutea.AAC.4